MLQTPTLTSVSEAAPCAPCEIKSAVLSDFFAMLHSQNMKTMLVMVICSYCHQCADSPYL